jgi:competence protein ComEC
MKRSLSKLSLLVLCVFLFTILSGCGGNSSTTSNQQEQPSVQQQAPPPVVAPIQSNAVQSNAPETTPVTQEKAKSPSAQTVQAAPTPVTTSTNQNQTYYIGATGTKYHYENCRTLKNTKTPISLSDAKAQGYTDCGVCKPPQ